MFGFLLFDLNKPVQEPTQQESGGFKKSSGVLIGPHQTPIVVFSEQHTSRDHKRVRWKGEGAHAVHGSHQTPIIAFCRALCVFVYINKDPFLYF